MNKAYLLIGGNIGDRTSNLEVAKKLINEKAGNIFSTSSLYETAAWGITDQAAFLNQVLLVETDLTADELLKQILSIEQEIGRKREIKFGPRTIDIDILFFNDDIIKTDNLIVPHPEVQKRRFALVPMNEIAGSLVHPVLHLTIEELLEKCDDPLEVKLYEV